MAYIVTADITDSMLTEAAFTAKLAAKITLSTTEVEDLAERRGVLAADIEITPVHNLVKKYAVAWVCQELCKDEIGKVKIEAMETDMYYQKYKVYKADVSELDAQITADVLTGNVDEMRDRQGPRVGTLMEGG